MVVLGEIRLDLRLLIPYTLIMPKVQIGDSQKSPIFMHSANTHSEEENHMPQNHMREFKVGEVLVGIVHASKNDYDTSSYQTEPMKHYPSKKVMTDSLTVVKVLKRGKLIVRENDADFVTELQAVRGGFYQCIYGPSIAYKFEK